VTGVVIADDTLADTIVKHYTDFYQLFINYNTGILSSADTCKLTYLAHLCPMHDGAIVFEARGLYGLVFDDPGIYFDNCSDSSSGDPSDTCRDCGYRRGHPIDSGRLAPIIAQIQQYFLFPNPNEGNFTVRQHLTDHNPVAAEIMDVTGRTVYQTTLVFDASDVHVQTHNLTPGLYVMNLLDSGGREYTFKFVVENQ
jgi:type IX secretion system substrate protein